MSGKVKEKGKRRPGRPPGSKNKVKEEPPAPIARANSVRKIRRPRFGGIGLGGFLQPNPKHMRLIQYWSKETKIGMQQIFDDFMNAGAVAAPKIYKGLINSRKAIEDLFDAETNTEVVGDKPRTESENNGSPDTNTSRPVARRRDDKEQPSLASVGPGHIEEVSADLGEIVGLNMAQAGDWARGQIAKEGLQRSEELLGVIDAPSTTTPEEEQIEEDDPDDEPPY